MDEQKHEFFRPIWRPRAALILAVVATLLLASLVIPVGQALWKSMDAAVFFALNGLLSEGGPAATFWAWANYRPVDLLSVLMMLGFLVLAGPVFADGELRRAFFGFISLLLVGLVVRECLDGIADRAGLVGPSPSLTLEPAYRLSELVPDLHTKDSSKESFPGDHAAVLMLWVAFLFIRRISVGSVLALALAVALMLPRLVGGAHALSDVAVGGLFVTLLTLALGYCTPFHGHASAWLEARFSPMIAWFGRHVPGLSYFSFFRVAENE